MKKTTRSPWIMIAFIAILSVALAGGAVWYFLLRETDPRGTTDQIDLLAGAYAADPESTDPESLVMLSVTGGLPRNSTFTFTLYDLDGQPITTEATMTATLTNLLTGETNVDLALTHRSGEATWSANEFGMQNDGWWQVDLAVQAGSGDPLRAQFTLLMPDPNLTGFDTPPAPTEDPAAAEQLDAAITRLTQRTSLRWWEWLSGGNGSIILARFSVTTTVANNQPNSFENQSLLTGRIAPASEQTAPVFRPHASTSVTIGDRAMQVDDGGTPQATNPTNYLAIDRYQETYTGADEVVFGMNGTVNGRPSRFIAFHVPPTNGQQEAWFGFWIDDESGEITQLYMLASNHYMHWIYFDINEPFEIEFPT